MFQGGKFPFCLNQATAFNRDLSSWNMTNAKDIGAMFSMAENFNSDIHTWNVSNVTNMEFLFYYARSFNQDLSSWDVRKVQNHESFANGATNWTKTKPQFE